MTFWLLALVLLEPVKSAEPPTSSGKTGTSASSTLPEAWRVAILGASLEALAFTWASAARTSGGSPPFRGRENSARALASTASSLFFQDAESLAPRPPASRQNFITSSGITKGGSCHPKRWRAPATSAAPRGEPGRPQGRAMRGRGSRLGRRTERDRGFAGDERRPDAGARFGNSGGHRLGGVGGHRRRVPAGGGR